MNRFRGDGLYLLDEPEAALSPMRQLETLRRMREFADMNSQFIIATHSPILMAFPGALLLTFDGNGCRRIDYVETEHYRVMKAFLDNPKAGVRRAFGLESEKADLP